MKRILYIVFLFAIYGNAQVINRASRFANDPFYPTTLTGVLAVLYNDYNGVSGDATALPQWNDLVNSNNATEVTNPPELDTSTGNVQVYFNTTDFLTWFNDGVLDLTPGTHSYWILIKWGGQLNLTDSGCWLCKSTGSTSTRQLQISMSSTGIVQVYIGGQTVDGAAGSLSNNSFLAMNVSPTEVNMWLDGVKEIDAITLTGTNTNTENLEIGSRESGGYNPTGNLQWIAIGTGNLDGTAISELNALYNEN